MQVKALILAPLSRPAAAAGIRKHCFSGRVGAPGRATALEVLGVARLRPGMLKR